MAVALLVPERVVTLLTAICPVNLATALLTRRTNTLVRTQGNKLIQVTFQPHYIINLSGPS